MKAQCTMGHATRQALLRLPTWYSLRWLILCYSFLDWAPVENIYPCPICKWVAVTTERCDIRIVVLVMAARLICRIAMLMPRRKYSTVRGPWRPWSLLTYFTWHYLCLYFGPIHAFVNRSLPWHDDKKRLCVNIMSFTTRRNNQDYAMTYYDNFTFTPHVCPKASAGDDTIKKNNVLCSLTYWDGCIEECVRSFQGPFTQVEEDL